MSFHTPENNTGVRVSQTRKSFETSNHKNITGSCTIIMAATTAAALDQATFIVTAITKQFYNTVKHTHLQEQNIDNDENDISRKH